MRETSQPTFHDFRGHESQADRHDGLRVRQQREGLRIVHAGTNEELDMIAESMDLLWGQTSTLKTNGLRIEEGGGNGSESVAGGIDHGDRRVVREGAQTNAGLGRCESPSKRPWFAAGVSTAPLLPDAAYTGLVLPMPGDMSGR